MTNEEKVNDFAIDALAVLSKVLHALQSSNMKGTILHSEISAAVKKGLYYISTYLLSYITSLFI